MKASVLHDVSHSMCVVFDFKKYNCFVFQLAVMPTFAMGSVLILLIKWNIFILLAILFSQVSPWHLSVFGQSCFNNVDRRGPDPASFWTQCRLERVKPCWGWIQVGIENTNQLIPLWNYIYRNVYALEKVYSFFFAIGVFKLMIDIVKTYIIHASVVVVTLTAYLL